jgi:hypothetical protein
MRIFSKMKPGASPCSTGSVPTSGMQPAEQGFTLHGHRLASLYRDASSRRVTLTQG